MYLEDGLVERLLADAADEPGSLPMLQEAMVLLWGTMSGRLLTRASYETLGHDGRSGLAVAMATKADATLADLPPDQRRMARRIFLRLVQFGEGRPDTRRQLGVDDLHAETDAPGTFEPLLQLLITNRLLTPSPDEARGLRVDIAHEMLIVGWPASREWVELRRNAEKTRRRLASKAEEWVRLGRGDSGLLDVGELAEAEHWLTGPDASDLGIDPDLRALAAVSRAVIERQALEKEAARQRELKAAQDLLQERGRRIKIVYSAAAIALALASLAVVTSILAVLKRGEAKEEAAAARKAEAGEKYEREIAEEATRKAEASRANAERRLREATALLLATRSTEGTDYAPQRRLLLAVEAVRATWDAHEPPVPAAEEALRKALVPFRGRVFPGHAGYVTDLVVSPKSLVATASTDSTARVWDLARTATRPTRAVLPLGKGLHPIAFGPAGQLAVGSADGSVKVWHHDAFESDSPSPTPTFVLNGPPMPAWRLAFTPDDRLAVAYFATKEFRVRLWRMPEGGKTTFVELEHHDREFVDFAMSPDGRLATGDLEGQIRVWDLRPGADASPRVVEPKYDRGVLNGGLSRLKFGPRGRLAAAGAQGSLNSGISTPPTSSRRPAC